MVGLLVRGLLAVGVGAAALLVGRDAPNFPFVEGMHVLAVLVIAVTATTVLQPTAAWSLKRRVSPRSRPWAP